MGYFSNKKKNTYRDLNIFLKERGYNFGYKEIALSLAWVNLICLSRAKISYLPIIEKEFQELKAIRLKYKNHIQKKHLTDYDPLKILEKAFPNIKTKENSNGIYANLDKRIEELENLLLLSSLAKIKISPRNLIILVWAYALKTNRESIDWDLVENLLNWSQEKNKNTDLNALFDSKKIAKKTLQKMYYKHVNANKKNKKEYENLVKLIYKKSFIEKISPFY